MSPRFYSTAYRKRKSTLLVQVEMSVFLGELWHSLGLDEHMTIVKMNPDASTLAVAWIATKFTEPLRLLATIVITPRIARAIGRVR